MIVLRRSRVTLAVLAAMLVVSLAVPSVDARLPRARTYHPGGPITLDTNLLSVSGVSVWSIDEFLKAATPLPPLGAAFVDAEQRYGINARFLLAAAVHESGWGRSHIARAKHNLFGYNAYDRDPLRFASAYDTFAANIDDTARFIKDMYLTRGGRWWGGQPTLRSMQQFWSSSHTWGINVSRIATSMHLDRLNGRKISFAAPILNGPLHPGEQASVHLGWVGGSIPTGVEFVATWEPIALDADVMTTRVTAPAIAPSSPSPGAAGSDGADAVRSTIAAGRRVGTEARRIALMVAAPVDPGRYLLHVEMRDTGRRLLPATERVRIPSVEVRVWGDRAVSYDVEPDAAGDGVVVRITNTGRATIPAFSPRIPRASRDPEAVVARSFVTVTASATDPANSAPLLLMRAPLVADLLPGARVSLDVRGIVARTGSPTNRLSVDVVVLGEAAWLGPYSPAGAWFYGARSGPPSPSGRSTQPD
jgi:hypothetical protein